MDHDEAVTIKPKEHLTLLASVNLAGGLRSVPKTIRSRQGKVFTINATKTKLHKVAKRDEIVAKMNPKRCVSKNHNQRSCF